MSNTIKSIINSNAAVVLSGSFTSDNKMIGDVVSTMTKGATVFMVASFRGGVGKHPMGTARSRT